MDVEKKLGFHILNCYIKGIVSIIIKPKLIVITLNSEYIYSFLTFLKKHQGLLLIQLMDLWVVDYPANLKRFEINYLLLSLKYRFRVLLKVNVSEDDNLKSISDIFKSSGWLERESWDMFGVYFSGHLDLRRILTDYGFVGFPLRKDFPLTGFVEVRYDDGEKRVVLEPLEMMQEFRNFLFLSPWERKSV